MPSSKGLFIYGHQSQLKMTALKRPQQTRHHRHYHSHYHHHDHQNLHHYNHYHYQHHHTFLSFFLNISLRELHTFTNNTSRPRNISKLCPALIKNFVISRVVYVYVKLKVKVTREQVKKAHSGVNV